MAFKSGITGGQISKLERDAYEPRLATLYALADALGVGPCDLTLQSIDTALKVRSASLVASFWLITTRCKCQHGRHDTSVVRQPWKQRP
jgi:transcriptional regulator with XRE-family HTH domain